jgi:CheY-like chemotaxis protein
VSAERSARIVLLVEDNAGDADLVQEMLEAVDGDRYHFDLVHVSRMSQAIDRLGQDAVDVILLDLGLPDVVGVDALAALQPHSGRTPIVVLTGHEDESLAMECITHGAQDYLSKNDIRPVPLRRSINYAINRSHEHEIRELRETLDRYREMTTPAETDGSIHATPPLRTRAPEAFASCVVSYVAVMRRYFDRLVVEKQKPREEMGRIVAELGKQGAGPRDLVDIHVLALGQMSEDGNTVKSRALAIEGRLVALEMMGLLVDYYRVRKSAPIR